MTDKADAKTQRILTTSFGAPVDDDQNTMTLGNPGPALL